MARVKVRLGKPGQYTLEIVLCSSALSMHAIVVLATLSFSLVFWGGK